jgi:thiamine-phosphate pyrophosphorylase
MAVQSQLAHSGGPSPRLYLITPQVGDPAALAERLADALDGGAVAAVLVRMADADERSLINHAKMLNAAAQERGAALLIDGHPEIVARAGSDGAHVNGMRALPAALELLKPERIAGVGGLKTRHDAMVAAEAGADYVMFGEPDASGHRPSFDAIVERVAWWSGLFVVPCVAYATTMTEVDELCAAGAEFIAAEHLILSDPRGLRAAVADVTSRLHMLETAG